MHLRLLVAVSALFLYPALAFAQVDGPLDTSAGGAAGGSLDTSAQSGLSRGPVDQGALSNETPLDVRRVVEGQRFAPNTSSSPYAVGDTLPDNKRLRPVPGYPRWSYGSAGGERIIVDPETNTVTDVVR
jgi:hypothetical protein